MRYGREGPLFGRALTMLRGAPLQQQEALETAAGGLHGDQCPVCQFELEFMEVASPDISACSWPPT